MSTFPNRRWLVIPTSITESIDFSQVLQSDSQSLRLSIDGTKTFVKYEVHIVLEDYTTTTINGETGDESSYTVQAGTYGRPSIYSEEYQEYTHEEILQLLATSDWTQPLPGLTE